MSRTFKTGFGKEAEELLAYELYDSPVRSGDEYLTGEKIMLVDKHSYFLKTERPFFIVGMGAITCSLVCLIGVCLPVSFLVKKILTEFAAGMFVSGVIFIIMGTRYNYAGSRRVRKKIRKKIRCDKHPYILN